MKRVPLKGPEDPPAAPKKPAERPSVAAARPVVDDVDEQTLAQAVTDPEVHKQVLKGISGPYSLGVGRPPETGGKLALVARVREARKTSVDTVKFRNRSVPCVIIGNFGPPEKL